jgi:hypothetical protein
MCRKPPVLSGYQHQCTTHHTPHTTYRTHHTTHTTMHYYSLSFSSHHCMLRHTMSPCYPSIGSSIPTRVLAQGSWLQTKPKHQPQKHQPSNTNHQTPIIKHHIATTQYHTFSYLSHSRTCLFCSGTHLRCSRTVQIEFRLSSDGRSDLGSHCDTYMFMYHTNYAVHATHHPCTGR